MTLTLFLARVLACGFAAMIIHDAIYRKPGRS
jgi:hypothetical protein